MYVSQTCHADQSSELAIKVESRGSEATRGASIRLRMPEAWNEGRAYARDLLVWIRFLSERRGSKPIWQADREDVAAYHAARRRSAPVHRISAASWNRAVAALEKFYVWAVEEGLIPASPFGSSTTWRRVRGGRFAPVRTVRAREPGARRGDLRFVGLDHFLSFRDVGLRGRQL